MYPIPKQGFGKVLHFGSGSLRTKPQVRILRRKTSEIAAHVDKKLSSDRNGRMAENCSPREGFHNFGAVNRQFHLSHRRAILIDDRNERTDYIWLAYSDGVPQHSYSMFLRHVVRIHSHNIFAARVVDQYIEVE